MARGSKKDSEGTRGALLGAAWEEMVGRGYLGASVDRILAQTGLTKGALYHHFPGKLALGIAVAREVVGPAVMERWAAPLADTDDPLPVLRELLAREGEEWGEETLAQGSPLGRLLQEVGHLEPEFRIALQEIQLAWQGALAQALERGQAAGTVKPEVDGDEAAMFIVSALEGARNTARSLHSREALRGAMRQLGAYLNGIAV